MGVYIFRSSVLEELLMKNRDWVDFGREIIPNSLKTRRVFAHMFADYWEDIGTVRSYFDASMEMTSPNPPFEFHDPKHLFFTHARALPGVVIREVHMSNCIICGGSRIDNGTITNSILGIRSIVKSGVNLNRCIVLGAEYYDEQRLRRGQIPIGIGENTKIENAIIDHNARIGKNVVIRGHDKMPDFECPQYVVRDGIVVVFKNATVPDGTVIG
jgi:glucose-1-phosphate adenylyltransferase